MPGRFKQESGLRIAAIHQTGALAEWNQAHPDRQAQFRDFEPYHLQYTTYVFCCGIILSWIGIYSKIRKHDPDVNNGVTYKDVEAKHGDFSDHPDHIPR